MTVDAKVQIGLSGEFLEGTSVTTPAGNNLFREGVVVSDPESPDARARILNQTPTGTEFGLAVRQVGEIDANIVTPVEVFSTSPLPVSGGVTVSNLPATYPVSDAKVSGVWGYSAGVSGAPSFPTNAKILQITATAPLTAVATFTINSGDLVTIPTAQSLTVEPRGNLVSPTLAFTGTTSYFIEYVV